MKAHWVKYDVRKFNDIGLFLILKVHLVVVVT